MERDPNDLLQTRPMEGIITFVNVTPGRADGLTDFVLMGASPDWIGQRFSLWGRPASDSPWGPSRLTVDGKAVTYPELMAWLCGGKAAARVVAHVNTNSYGTAVSADFFTVTQEGLP